VIDIPPELDEEPMTLEALEAKIGEGSINMSAVEFDAWLDPIMKSLVGCKGTVRAVMLRKIKVQTGVGIGALDKTLKGYVKQAKQAKANETRRTKACEHVFEMGSHVELAQKALFDLRASSDADIKYVHGLFWRYSQTTGLWSAVNGHDGNDEVARLVQSYDGAETMFGSLALDHSDVEGAVKQAARAAGDAMFFEGAQRGVIVTNGFLTMDAARDPKHRPRTPVLLPHDPNNRARHALAIAYDPTARAPRFEQFLEECLLPDAPVVGACGNVGDADLICGVDRSGDAYKLIWMLQEFCGAALFGCAPQFARAAMLHGTGHNGKSTFLNVLTGTDTQDGLFSRDLQDAVAPQHFSEPYYVASLDGKLINVVNEVPDRELVNSAGFKAIVDGSVVKARNPYERTFSFRPRCAHAFAVNLLPPSSDYTLGYKRRWLVVPWLKTFAGKKDEGGLADRIIRDELQGVLNWCIEGAQRLLFNDGYTIPDVAQKAADEWHSSNAIGLWLLEQKSTRKEGQIVAVKYSRDQLHQEFMSWADLRGFHLMNAVTFSQQLQVRGYEQKKTEDGVQYFVMPEMASIVPRGLEEIAAERRKRPHLRVM
jgi:phage/plasmid-associated DNA primase